jgi:hypothetical protein
MKTMKLQIAGIIFLAMTLLTVGCKKDDSLCMEPNGKVVTTTLPLPTITGVDLNIDAEVIFYQGTTQEVKITGSSNLIANLKQDVKDGIWLIEYKDCVSDPNHLKIEIRLAQITYANLRTSGTISTDGHFVNAEELVVNVPGDGNITLEADAVRVITTITGHGKLDLTTHCDVFSADISGTGDMILNGECIDESILIRGNGNFFGFGLVAQDADVEIRGNGNCEITVTDSLKATISGSGSLWYKGNPFVESHVTGSGTITHVNN